jgi:hypothetical protein
MDDESVPMLVRLPYDLLPAEAQTLLLALRSALRQFTDYEAAQITFEALREPVAMTRTDMTIDVYVPRFK